LKSKDQLNTPDPTTGDTVLHFALKKTNLEALSAMLEHGGNPFIKNKKGESIESLLQRSEFEIPVKIAAKINELKSAPIQCKESPVHKSVRDNNVNRLKILKMCFASLESYNYHQERPGGNAIKKIHS
jgi:hypothetical protein